MLKGTHTRDGTWAKHTVDWTRSQNKRLQRPGPSVRVHLPAACALPAVCVLLCGVQHGLIWVIFSRGMLTASKRVHAGPSLHAAAAKWKSPVSKCEKEGVSGDGLSRKSRGDTGLSTEGAFSRIELLTCPIMVTRRRSAMPFFIQRNESKGQRWLWSMHCRTHMRKSQTLSHFYREFESFSDKTTEIMINRGRGGARNKENALLFIIYRSLNLPIMFHYVDHPLRHN